MTESPIHRVPPDVIAEIFKFCLPQTLADSPYDRMKISTSNPPILFCSVCWYWRTVAISTPRLWRIFDFDIHSYGREVLPLDSIESGINTWMERAGNVPVTIVLTCSAPRQYGAQVFRVYAALSKHAEKWEHVSISDAQNSFSSWPISELPLLRSLSVTGIEKIDGAHLTSAPRLTALYVRHFTYVRGSFPIHTQCIPWHQLTDLTIGHEQAVDAAIELIRLCSVLKSLTLLVHGFDSNSTLPSARNIKNTALVSVHLTMEYDCHVLLESLTLPALMDFTLICLQGSVSPYTGVTGLVTRSHCILRALTLICDINFDQLLEFLNLQSCQSLTHLHVSSYIKMRDELFCRLTYPRNGAPLCPKLLSLKLSGCCLKRTSPGMLGKMIMSRYFRLAEKDRLESFHLRNASGLNKEDRAMLVSARLQGLDLVLLVHSYGSSGDTDTSSDMDQGSFMEGTDADADTDEFEHETDVVSDSGTDSSEDGADAGLSGETTDYDAGVDTDTDSSEDNSNEDLDTDSSDGVDVDLDPDDDADGDSSD